MCADCAIVGYLVEGIAGGGKPGFVHHGGTGGPNPVGDAGHRANMKCVLEDFIHAAVILSNAVVVATPEHSTEHVLVVDAVVDFSDLVVADIDVGESDDEAGGTPSRGILEDAARTGRCGGAAQQFQ